MNSTTAQRRVGSDMNSSAQQLLSQKTRSWVNFRLLCWSLRSIRRTIFQTSDSNFGVNVESAHQTGAD
ncbi:hypothetical protein Mapa_015954 [Marchantia paleacea]|nr:hypothetical protein Mapa_015954 [Marchantia paleacea]